MDKDNWKGTKPFTKTYTTPECTRTGKSGGELNWELKACEKTDARAFCQSKKYVQGGINLLDFQETCESFRYL